MPKLNAGIYPRLISIQGLDGCGLLVGLTRAVAEWFHMVGQVQIMFVTGDQEEGVNNG